MDHFVGKGSIGCQEEEAGSLFIESADREKVCFGNKVVDKAIAGEPFVAAEIPFGFMKFIVDMVGFGSDRLSINGYAIRYLGGKIADDNAVNSDKSVSD